MPPSNPPTTLRTLALSLLRVAASLVALLFLGLRRRSALAAENLFLRKQLALYVEREKRPRRARPATRLSLALLSRLFDWREALLVVRPATLVRWHRLGFRLLWRLKSRPGRPPVPEETRQLIARIARENPSWGEETIAAHLLVKLGLRLSPRTVRKYMPTPTRPGPRGDQRWTTFVRNHAESLVACDFLTCVTATFQVFYVFLVLEVGNRRILHLNVTAHPTADWTRQQLRHAIPCEHPYRFLLHDRDSIYSRAVDRCAENFGLRVLRTPVRAPRANAFCERAIGTLRRECLDWLIPLGESHLRRILREWIAYYNQARPHSALGPGLPDPPPGLPLAPQAHRHRLPPGSRVVATPVLGGLHHDYRLHQRAA